MSKKKDGKKNGGKEQAAAPATGKAEAERAALATAGTKLSEAATSFAGLESPSAPVRLLREEVRDVMARINEQRSQMEG